jgi:hypothetical protein
MTKPLGEETSGAALNKLFRTINTKRTRDIIAGADLIQCDSFLPNINAVSRQRAHKRPENKFVLSPGITTMYGKSRMRCRETAQNRTHATRSPNETFGDVDKLWAARC